MKSDTVCRVEKLTDGPGGNQINIYAIMLSIAVPGVDKPFRHRIGEFSEGYESFAKEFCDWFNARQETPQ